MALITIHQLPDRGTLDGTEELPLQSGGSTMKTTSQAVANLFVEMQFPPGLIFPYAGPTVPAGYLECDGSAVSRTAYANLFGVLGTAWGVGDGSTTFNLPDFRDRVLVGDSPGSLSGRPTARTLADVGGEETHTLVDAELPTTTVNVTDPGHNHAPGVGGTQFIVAGAGNTFLQGAAGAFCRLGGLTTGSRTTGITAALAGGSGAHENMQPFGVVKWIIKT